MNGIKLQISRDVYDKVMWWVKHASFEVSGFGTVTFDEKENAFTVNDAFLLKQEGGAAHTDIDPTALSQLMYQAHMAQAPGDLKWWWHSHVNMGTFWSTQDLSTIKELGSNGWIVATVFNKKEEMKSAYAARAALEPVGHSTYVSDNVETIIWDYYDQADVNAWETEFTEKVTEKKYDKYAGTVYGDAWTGHMPLIENDHVARYEAIEREEAKAAGISHKKYVEIMYGGDREAIDKLQAKIDKAYLKTKPIQPIHEDVYSREDYAGYNGV